MILLPSKRLLYLETPRTACRATGDLLCSLGATRSNQRHDCPDKRLAEKLKYEEWTVITTVRNPYDMLVSWYFTRSREKEGWSLEEFLSVARVKNLYLKTDLLNRYDKWLTSWWRYESLQLDIWRTLGTTKSLPIVGKSNRDPDYRIYYTPELQAKVAQWYKRDIERFGYEF